MASPSSISLFIFFLLVFFFTDLCTDQVTVYAAKTEYLKLPLLHTTSFPSPTEALSLDTHRLSHFFLSSLHRKKGKSKPALRSPVVSGASSGSGQYFANLRLGSPPQYLLLVVDTGSDLIWIKCSACRNCSLHAPGTAFFARHSSTFSPFHCYDSACRLVPHARRAEPCKHTRLHSPCRYEYSYADGSLTAGFFSSETTMLNTSSGREAKLRKLAFGCGFRISGPSLSGSSFNGAQGVMGLGRGPISFSSQLGRRFGNKFSYCLMDYTLSPPPISYLLIGDAANDDVSKKRRMRFTPLLVNPLSPTFYYIRIKSVSVNDTKLRIDPSVWSIDESGNGGTIIDSGTTLTFLAEPAYSQILTAFRRTMRLPMSTKPTPGFDLCFNISGESRPSFPRLRFELAGDSVFSPPPTNYFIDTEFGVKCLAIQPVNQGTGFSVIGNLMQQGFLLEFDRDRSRLGFSRRGCGQA